MENKVKLLIELGLQRDEDQGDVAVVAFDLPRSVAERVCREQESCQLLSECGDLTRLLNAYAVMNGYQCAWFISAEMQDDSADALIEENAELRESVLFLQTELEEARKSVQAHELAGKLFEMKNTQLEKKLEAVSEERDVYKNWCEGLKNKLAIAVGYKNAGIPDNAVAAHAEAEMWLRVTLHEKKSVRQAIYRMRDELKAGRIHFDGISLKAIPFDSVDAVAEKVLREVADGAEK